MNKQPCKSNEEIVISIVNGCKQAHANLLDPANDGIGEELHKLIESQFSLLV